MWDDKNVREKVKRVVTPEKALQKLMVLCSKSEKSSPDAIKLMKKWEIPSSEMQNIIDTLQRERYIDDNRYIEMYVRDKVRFSTWGGRKIIDTLAAKGLSKALVSSIVAEQLSTTNPKEKLSIALKKRYEQINIKEENVYKLKDKLFRFAASRGYDFDDIRSVIDTIVGSYDDE